MRLLLSLNVAAALTTKVGAQSLDSSPREGTDSRFTALSPVLEKFANATVTRSFDGHDLTKNFSADAKADTEWEAFLQIAHNVAEEEFDTRADPDSAGRRGLLERIGIRPKSTEGIKLDNDWSYCTVLMPFSGLNIPIDQPVNGDCTGVFSEVCLTWLQDLAKNGTACHRDMIRLDDGGQGFWPKECRNLRNKQTYGGGPLPFPIESGNLSTVAQDGGVGSVLVTQYSEDLESERPYWLPKDLQYYQAINNVWLIMVGWHGSKSRAGAPGLRPQIKESEMAEGSLVCLRVEDFAEGSKSFEDGVVKYVGELEDDKNETKEQNEDEDEDGIAGKNVISKTVIGLITTLAIVTGLTF